MRGNRDGGEIVAAECGSIPACAGEPHAQKMQPKLRQVYPRVCGGTGREFATGKFVSGLSPRVRGNHGNIRLVKSIRRSIPACAGEPYPTIVPIFSDWVYPRVCGGTFRQGDIPHHIVGLSPRVRGNLLHSVLLVYKAGSIPACAGEPLSTCSANAIPAVYPRVCGGT